MEVETFIDIDGKVLKKQIIRSEGNFTDIIRVEYRYNGKLHRKGGPAIIECYEHEHLSGWPNNIETWCSHGRTHRLDGPAITEEWDGKIYYFFCKRNELCSVQDILKGEELSWWVISHKKTKDPAIIINEGLDEVWTD